MRSYARSSWDVVSASVSLVAFLTLLFFLLPISAFAATLAVTPASGNYSVGTTFTASIAVQSDGTPLNAVSGILSFPADELEVVALTKGGSIITLWIQEPSFSNTAGTIQFEGVVPSPGYSGVTGKVLGVTFRVKATGQSLLSFSAGSVLANDGEGTEILTAKKSTQLQLSPAVPVTLPTPSVTPPVAPAIYDVRGAASTPSKSIAAPEVTSTTHPGDLWSRLTTGVFAFRLTSDVTALRLLLDDKPTTVPVVTYVPPVATREIADLSEGVSYLHVQYKTAAGWGVVTHYKLQIDTTPPVGVTVSEVAPGAFALNATDTDSGIARYEVQIDGGEPRVFMDDGSHIYKTPALASGAHTILVRAIDAAGNLTETTHSFTMIGLKDVPSPIAQPAPDATDDSLLVTKGTLAIAILSVVTPLVALVLLLGWLLYLAWRALGGIQRKVEIEVTEARAAIHQSFAAMRTEFGTDIELLRKASVKRKLTREESKILKHLQQNIDAAEAAITKEVADIDARS